MPLTAPGRDRRQAATAGAGGPGRAWTDWCANEPPCPWPRPGHARLCVRNPAITGGARRVRHPARRTEKVVQHSPDGPHLPPAAPAAPPVFPIRELTWFDRHAGATRPNAALLANIRNHGIALYFVVTTCCRYYSRRRSPTDRVSTSSAVSRRSRGWPTAWYASHARLPTSWPTGWRRSSVAGLAQPAQRHV